MYKRILFIAICCLLISSVYADDGDHLNIEKVGSLSYWDCAFDVAISGSYAYVTTGRSGLSILDITDLSDPIEVGVCCTSEGYFKIAVAGNYAYVTSISMIGVNSLMIIDITDPTHPFEVGKLEGLTSPRAVDVSGDYVYIANSYDGVNIINVSDPTNPVNTLHYRPGTDVYDLTVHENLCFLARHYEGMYVLDVSDPASPELLGIYNSLRRTLNNVYYQNGYAYVGEIQSPSQSFVQMLDVSDPSTISVVSTLEVGANEYLYDFSDGYGYLVTDDRSVVRIVDFSDPANPSLLTTYDDSEQIYGILSYEDHLLLAGDNLSIIDLTNPSQPSLLSSINKNIWIDNIKKVGNYAYLIQESKSSMLSFDVSDLSNPVQIGQYESEGRNFDFDATTGYAYILVNNDAEECLLEIVNTTDSASPVRIGSLLLPEPSRYIELIDDFIFVSEWYGVRIIDISDRENPVIEGYISTTYMPQGYFLENNTLFCTTAGSSGLKIIDISSPETPVLLNSVEVSAEGGEYLDIEIENGFAYIPNELNTDNQYEYTLYIVDVSDVNNPVSAGSISLEDRCGSIELSDNVLYLGLFDKGIQVYNVIDPTNPVEVGFYDTYGTCVEIELSEDYVIAADLFNLDIFNCSEAATEVGDDDSNLRPETFAIASTYPNPFNPTLTVEMSLPKAGQLDLSVHNIMGQKVANITREYYSAGVYNFTFDGSELSSGIYFIHASSPGQLTQTCKIILMK